MNPDKTAEEDFAANTEKRHKLVVKFSYLEPPFPWKVVPFSPGLFSLNDIPDPIDFTSRGIVLR